MTAPIWHDLPLRVVTPAFLGRFAAGEQSRQSVPFPVPSLRGTLAYWLRALAGAHLGNQIPLLHQTESAVLGSARSGDTGGPSPILLRAPRVLMREYAGRDAEPGVQYLLGPGLLSAPPPRCLPVGETIKLRVKNTGSPAHADLFLAGLWALRTFGGIGARTRRGLGTIAVEAVPDELATRRFDPTWLRRDDAGDLTAVLDSVRQAMTDLPIPLPVRPDLAEQPRYPNFAGAHYEIGSDELGPGDVSSALGVAGVWLKNYRHGGHQSEEGQYHSETYNQVAQPFLDGRPPRGPLLAGALGLPIPYSDHQGQGQGPKRGQRTATVDVVINGTSARRASPLWLRVHKDRTTWRLRSLAFYAEWLPDGAELRIKSGPRSSPVTRPTTAQVHDELTRWFHP
jgi:hypothetical protein